MLQHPLEEPVASCPLGKLYNKDAVLEYLLDRDKYGDGEEICGHLKSMKVRSQHLSPFSSGSPISQDLKTLKLTRNTSKSPPADGGPGTDRASFMCPLNFKEMNGSQPFVYLSPCGCVFSLSGLKAVIGAASPGNADGQLDTDAKGKEKAQDGDAKQLDMCPQCGAKFDRAADIVTLNPAPEEEEKMRAALERRRAAEPKGKGKKRKAKAEAAGAEEKPAEKRKKQASPMPGTNPNVAAASRAVAQSLAEEEAKRKATMSDAVKSLYQPKNSGKKETFMTMGTFTRVRAAFLSLCGLRLTILCSMLDVALSFGLVHRCIIISPGRFHSVVRWYLCNPCMRVLVGAILHPRR